jgi:ribose transport system substrate-binding protein
VRSNPSRWGLRARHAPGLAALLALSVIASACVTVTGDDSAEASVAPSIGASAPVSAPASVTPDPTAAPPSSSVSQPPAAVTAAPEPTPEPAAATPEPAAATTELAAATPDPTTPATEPTAPPLSTQPSIGYISLDESQAFVQAVSTGVRQAAADASMTLIECDSGWTRPGVRACAKQLAEAGVHGVVSLQPFSDLAAEVCTTLGDAPTIGIVYDQGPCQVSLLQIDQVESGRLAGAAMGELAAKRWDCDVKAFVSLESGADDIIGGARMSGYREGYKEHCQLPTKKYRLSEAQHFITAKKQMGPVLDAVKGKPILVAGVSDVAILGAMEAVAGNGRADHVWYSGQLADPAIRQTIACDDHYIASVAQFPERFGATAVPTLIDAIDGRDVPEQVAAELELVTAANVRQLFPDTPACDG